MKKNNVTQVVGAQQGFGCSSFALLLTIVFVTLKLLSVISWAWWLVWLPVIILGGIWVIVGLAALAMLIFVWASER